VAAIPALPGRPPADSDERLRGALTGMGFKPGEADRAIAALSARTATLPLEELLREALALLAK
jgi:Holliday junction DNA helicase RuvA